MPNINAQGTAVSLNEADDGRVAIVVESTLRDNDGKPRFRLSLELPANSPAVPAIPLGAPVSVRLSIPDNVPTAPAPAATGTADQEVVNPPADPTADAGAPPADPPADPGEDAPAADADPPAEPKADA